MSVQILVADDEPPIVDILATVLEDEGYAILRAYDGAMALEIFERERPALLISDVMMPRLSGIDLAARVRAGAPEHQPPIVLISAAPPPPVELADTIVLTKPFDIDEIVELVATLLGGGAGGER